MGGLLSFPNRWVQFEERWRAALDEWELEHFHMTDFESRHGPYKEWTDQERKDRLSHLLDLIETHTIASVGLGLPTEIYETLVAPELRSQITPYHLLAFLCFIEVSKLTTWAGDEIKRMSPGTNLDDVRNAFVYETVTKGSGPILATYEVLNRIPELKDSWRFVSLDYQRKQDFGALQGADILAYEMYKDLPRVQAESPREPRYPMRRLLASRHPRKWGYCSYADMEPRIEGLRQMLVDLHVRGFRG